MKISEVAGRKFGHLTAVGPVMKNFRPTATWNFRCDCGNECKCCLRSVTEGKITSCGCVPFEPPAEPLEPLESDYNRLHGIWGRMLSATRNPNTPQYAKAGAKGIQVCPEWRKFPVFRDWALESGYVEDMDNTYVLRRLNEDGDFCPENCVWKVLAGRYRKIPELITLDGVTRTIPEWAKEIGTPPGTIYNERKKGIAPEIYIRYRLAVPGTHRPTAETILAYAARSGWLETA